MKERKKLLQKNKICMKRKFILKTKEKFILWYLFIFLNKGEFDIMGF